MNIQQAPSSSFALQSTIHVVFESSNRLFVLIVVIILDNNLINDGSMTSSIANTIDGALQHW